MSIVRSVRIAALVVTCLFAFVAGFVTAPENASAVTLTVARVNPGPAAISPATMTCLWHRLIQPCGTLSDAQALDWANSDGSGVQFRTWAFRGAGTGVAYYATKSINNSNCRRVRMRLESPAGTIRGDEYYTHTKIFGTDGFTYSITGQTSYYYTAHTIGLTVRPYEMSDPSNTDLSTCTSTGPHLHQGASATAARNSGTYTAVGNYFSITVNAAWQHEWSWNQ